MKILDIGANNGNYAKRLCIPNTSVVAVEPNPYHSPNLDGYNILWERKAVSDCCGTAEMHIAHLDVLNTLNQEWLSKGRFFNQSSGHKFVVETTTIDALVEKYGAFDHIKMDVEGYENIAVKGMTKKYCPIQFEWASEWVESVTKEALQHLLTLGYTKFNFLWGQHGIHDFDPHNLPTDSLTHAELIVKLDEVCTNLSEPWGMILAR